MKALILILALLVFPVACCRYADAELRSQTELFHGTTRYVVTGRNPDSSLLPNGTLNPAAIIVPKFSQAWIATQLRPDNVPELHYVPREQAPVATPVATFGSICVYIPQPFTPCPYIDGVYQCICFSNPGDSTFGADQNLTRAGQTGNVKFETGNRWTQVKYDVPEGWILDVILTLNRPEDRPLDLAAKTRTLALSDKLMTFTLASLFASPFCIVTPFPVNCFASLMTTSTVSFMTSYYTHRAAFNDPWEDYRTVAMPVPPPVQPAQNTGNAAVNAAIVARDKHMAEASGLANAIYHSSNRWRSALECATTLPRPTRCPMGVNDVTMQAVHKAKVIEYEAALRAKLAQLPPLLVTLRNALIAAGMPPLYVSPEAILESQMTMDAYPLNLEARLTAVGLDAEQRAELFGAIAWAEPPTVGVVIPHDLITQAQATDLGYTGIIPPPPAYAGNPDPSVPYVGMSITLSPWTAGPVAGTQKAILTARNTQENPRLAPFYLSAPNGTMFHPCNCQTIPVTVPGGRLNGDATATFPITVKSFTPPRRGEGFSLAGVVSRPVPAP